jgi:hypothetical protein
MTVPIIVPSSGNPGMAHVVVTTVLLVELVVVAKVLRMVVVIVVLLSGPLTPRYEHSPPVAALLVLMMVPLEELPLLLVPLEELPLLELLLLLGVVFSCGLCPPVSVGGHVGHGPARNPRPPCPAPNGRLNADRVNPIARIRNMVTVRRPSLRVIRISLR